MASNDELKALVEQWRKAAADAAATAQIYEPFFDEHRDAVAAAEFDGRERAFILCADALAALIERKRRGSSRAGKEGKR